MKRSTSELYGTVPRDILDTRNSLAKYFIEASKKKIKEIQSVGFYKRDEALLNDCIKAKEHWEKLLDEEI